MLSTLQAEPVNQRCHWVVGLGERASKVVVRREKVGIKSGDVIVLLCHELSGSQERLAGLGCRNVDLGFGRLEVCM